MRALVIPIACLAPLAGCGSGYETSGGGFDRERYQSELRLLCGMSLAMSGEIRQLDENRVCACTARRAIDGQSDEALRARVAARDRREQEGQIINACVAEARAARRGPTEFNPDAAQREIRDRVENTNREMNSAIDDLMRAEQEMTR